MPISLLRGARQGAAENGEFPTTSGWDRRANEREATKSPLRARARRLAPQPESKRPMLAAAGVLIVLICAASGADLATRVDHKQPYMVVARYIPQGSVIESSDLSTAELSVSDGVAAVPASDASRVVGLRASEPLWPATLLEPADLTAGGTLPANYALVGASLEANQLPEAVAVGDAVIVVVSSTSGTPTATGGTASSSSGAPSTGSVASDTQTKPASVPPGAAATGVVYALAAPSQSAQTAGSTAELVTLEVPISEAAAIAAASAAGDVSIAELPATQTGRASTSDGGSSR